METKNKQFDNEFDKVTMDNKKYDEVDFENDIFEVYASYKPEDGEGRKYATAMLCAESLAMRHYCYLEAAKGIKPIILDYFFNNYREDLRKKNMSAEDIFDKYFRKEMKEDYRNKVLEMINFIRNFKY